MCRCMYIYVYESIPRHIEWLDNVSARVATPPSPYGGSRQNASTTVGFRV